ncbi:hypothetical protein GPL21_23925 [Bradyrhizobium pachyrhizi]|uniref:Uncharacterized protein n=1 Tax=Bradyrhizobium pachyrhizi TaxID=280333 RepID=A0A844SZ67_9BRAD|nr:hypothetical protein [Bradyrhizobium pachyrhizi]
MLQILLQCSQGFVARAFSSEVDAGSREENASKQESRASFRFHRNGKRLQGAADWALISLAGTTARR